MAPKLQNKRSSNANNRPNAGTLDAGEIAINTNENSANIHFEDASANVRTVGSDPLTAGTYARNVASNGAAGTWTAALASVDLGYTQAATQGTVTNTAGTDATLPFATSTNAGLFIEAATPGTATTQYARQVTTGGVATWAQVAIPPGTIVDSTEPASPADGQLWFNTTAGNNTLWVWDDDATPKTWRPAVPQVPDGGGGDYENGEVRERVFYLNEPTINENYDVGAVGTPVNAGSFGPITIAGGGTVAVDVANGSTWTICGGAGQSIDTAGFWSRDAATTTLSPVTAGDNVSTSGAGFFGSWDDTAAEGKGVRLAGGGQVSAQRESSIASPKSSLWRGLLGTVQTSQIAADGSATIGRVNFSSAQSSSTSSLQVDPAAGGWRLRQRDNDGTNQRGDLSIICADTTSDANQEGAITAGTVSNPTAFSVKSDGSISVDSPVTANSFNALDIERTCTAGQAAFIRVVADCTSGLRAATFGTRWSTGAANAAGYMNLPRPSTGAATYYYTGIDNNFIRSTSVNNIGTNNGTVVGTQTSDSRLKKNIRSCDHGLAEVMQLQPKFFEYISDPETAQAGFIAQEVQPIIPEAVYDTGDTLIPPELVDPNDESQGYKPNPSASEPTVLAMDYVKLIPALVNAIKELQAEIETLKGGTN